MIFSETYAGIGCPKDLVPIGIYIDSEEPVDANGFGFPPAHGMQVAIETFTRRLRDKRGCDAVILGAQIFTECGTGHATCRRIVYRIQGDVYIRKVGPEPDRRHLS